MRWGQVHKRESKILNNKEIEGVGFDCYFKIIAEMKQKGSKRGRYPFILSPFILWNGAEVV